MTNQNHYHKRHDYHPNYVVPPEVAHEFNLLNDFLHSSLLDDADFAADDQSLQTDMTRGYRRDGSGSLLPSGNYADDISASLRNVNLPPRMEADAMPPVEEGYNSQDARRKRHPAVFRNTRELSKKSTIVHRNHATSATSFEDNSFREEFQVNPPPDSRNGHELSKRHAIAHLSHTISADYSEDWKVRKQRLCALSSHCFQKRKRPSEDTDSGLIKRSRLGDHRWVRGLGGVKEKEIAEGVSRQSRAKDDLPVIDIEDLFALKLLIPAPAV